MQKSITTSITINLDDCKTFDLSSYQNESIAFKAIPRNERDYICCYDEDEEKYFPHLLIFKNSIKVLWDETYGPDNNFTTYHYIELNDKELEYVKENGILDNIIKKY